ncbi:MULTISPECIES: YbjN domain-containing protein [Sphingopyxis]|nr:MULTISPECIES: YbjN domain-containing protein [Sphingopyxis]
MVVADGRFSRVRFFRIDTGPGRRCGRSYLDRENDPSIEMRVNMAAGGRPAELFEDMIDLWIEIFATFDNFVVETQTEASAEPPSAPAEVE